MAWGEIARVTDRGFGFVKSHYPPAEDVFIYLAVLQRAGIEPRVGIPLEFEVEEKNGKPRVRWAKRLKTWRDADSSDDPADRAEGISGRIVHLNEARGFLFVSRDDNPGVRVYCKYNALRRSGVPAVEGQRVIFSVGEHAGRPCVVEIAPADGD